MPQRAACAEAAAEQVRQRVAPTRAAAWRSGAGAAVATQVAEKFAAMRRTNAVVESVERRRAGQRTAAAAMEAKHRKATARVEAGEVDVKMRQGVKESKGL